MKKLFSLLMVVLMAGLLSEQISKACTNFLVTKGASVKGDVINISMPTASVVVLTLN